VLPKSVSLLLLTTTTTTKKLNLLLTKKKKKNESILGCETTGNFRLGFAADVRSRRGEMLQISLFAILWVGGTRPALPAAYRLCGGASVRSCLQPRLGPRMQILPPEMSTAPPAYAAYTAAGPLLSMFELTANGRTASYQSTLTSMHATHKLSARDVRLLRSSTPVLAVRNGFVLFDLGDVKGVLQHDRVVMFGHNMQKVKTIGSEVQQRFESLSRSDAGEGYPFEVKLLECLYEVSYTLLEQSLQRLSGLIHDLLAQLTDSSAAQSDSRRGAALGRLLPLQISLNELRTRSRRLTTVLQELLEGEDELSGMCLSLFERRKRGKPPARWAKEQARVAAAKAAEKVPHTIYLSIYLFILYRVDPAIPPRAGLKSRLALQRLRRLRRCHTLSIYLYPSIYLFILYRVGPAKAPRAFGQRAGPRRSGQGG